MAEGRISMLMQDVINKVKEISEISGYICIMRKPFFSLAGRLTIMVPFFQEIRDVIHHASRDLYDAMTSLLVHLESTRKLLQQGSTGSKIYLVLEREQIRSEYEAAVAHLEEDLKRIYFQKLDLSNEVKEQAEFVLGQFDRARGKQFDASSADNELYEDLFFLYKGDGIVDPEVLKGVVQTLKLNKVTALEQEAVVLNEMIIARNGERVENLEKMFKVLNYIKDYLHIHNRTVVSSPGETYICARQGIANLINEDNKVIPNEFLCPISLQLMHDPVIISTGQTYERSSIQTWIQQGNGTCPTTMQLMTDTTLTPNFALRNLIAQWCTTNRLEYAPKGASSTISYSCTPAERELISISIEVLEKSIYYHHKYRGAAGKLYQLAKRGAQIREAIGEAGAIPLLLKALNSIHPDGQKYAMEALLNLSICPRNKKRMVEAGVIPAIIDEMNSDDMELSEDGAVILVSLSVTDEIKCLIGSHGGLKPLVYLLREGSDRGRKEAATALLILCSIPCNVARAVKFGVIPVLISHVLKRYGPLKDEALALLDIVASHRDAIPILLQESHKYTRCLIKLLYEGSRNNQQNAVSILLKLGVEDPKYLEVAQQLGVVHYLMELERNGSDEAKRNAKQLLQRLAAHMHATARKRALINPECEASTSTSTSRPRRRARRN